MKTTIPHFLGLLFVLSPRLFGQAGFIYDQQSSDESNRREGGVQLRNNAPVGQSFTPALNSVGSIRLDLVDSPWDNGTGATIHLNLRADSIMGPTLASTESRTFADHFLGFPDFYFPNPVPVTPGQTYAFKVVLDSGDNWLANA